MRDHCHTLLSDANSFARIWMVVDVRSGTARAVLHLTRPPAVRAVDVQACYVHEEDLGGPAPPDGGNPMRPPGRRRAVRPATSVHPVTAYECLLLHLAAYADNRGLDVRVPAIGRTGWPCVRRRPRHS